MDCPYCGDEIQHEDQNLGDRVLTAWRHPKVAFLLGTLLGIIVIGSIAISPPSTVTAPTESGVGDRVVDHYERISPNSVSYTIDDVEQHDSGLYAVTVTVTRGNITSDETVYVTEDGKWVFETPPNHVKPTLSQ